MVVVVAELTVTARSGSLGECSDHHRERSLACLGDRLVTGSNSETTSLHIQGNQELFNGKRFCRC